jgi:hypothetical protein
MYSSGALSVLVPISKFKKAAGSIEGGEGEGRGGGGEGEKIRINLDYYRSKIGGFNTL